MGVRVAGALLLVALLAGCAENRLLTELQRHSAFAATAPQPTAPAIPATEPALATPQPPAPPNTATPPAGNFGVQIAARPSEAEGRALIEEMRGRFPDLLGKQWAALYRVSLPEGVYYRVVVGRLETAQQAMQLCDSLKAQGVGCFIRAT